MGVDVGCRLELGNAYPDGRCMGCFLDVDHPGVDPALPRYVLGARHALQSDGHRAHCDRYDRSYAHHARRAHHDVGGAHRGPRSDDHRAHCDHCARHRAQSAQNGRSESARNGENHARYANCDGPSLLGSQTYPGSELVQNRKYEQLALPGCARRSQHEPKQVLLDVQQGVGLA